MPFGHVYSTTGEFMKSRMQPKTVRLTSEQEQRLAKLYSILDMINPAQPAQNQQDYENEKTVVLAEASAN